MVDIAIDLGRFPRAPASVLERAVRHTLLAEGVEDGEVSVALIDDVASAGGVVWRTHPFGYLLRRSTGQHTWNVDERYFERQAEQRWDGLALDVVGVCEVGGPPAG